MSDWSNKTQADLERYEKMLSESDIPLTYDVPTLFKLIRGWQEVALHEAASVMPIETLHGSDDSSVWLREYADNWGKDAEKDGYQELADNPEYQRLAEARRKKRLA